MPTFGFVAWKDQLGNTISTSPSMTISVNQDMTLIAEYVGVQKYDLTINPVIGGTTNPIPGIYSCDPGATVNVLAMPSTGYSFVGWIVDDVTAGATNPISVVMNANHTLEPVFQPIGPHQGTLECHAYLDSAEVVANVQIVEAAITRATPFSQDLDVGTYTVTAEFQGKTQTKSATITELQVTRLDFQFGAPVPIGTLVGIAGPVAVAIAISALPAS